MDAQKNITFKCPACGTEFLSMNSTGHLMTCPHCATAAPKQNFAPSTSSAVPKKADGTKKTSISQVARPTLPLAGSTSVQGHGGKSRLGLAWFALVIVAGLIGTAAIFVSIKNQGGAASVAPSQSLQPVSTLSETDATDYGSPMVHEGLIRPLADRLVHASDIHVFAECFADGATYLKEMEPVWDKVKQLNTNLLGITIVPIVSLPDNRVIYLGVWPDTTSGHQTWVALKSPVDTKNPKLNWPVFYESTTQRIDNLFTAKPGESAKVHLIAKRTHAFELPEELRDNYIPILVQCTKNDAVLATAFLEKTSPNGQILSSKLEWNKAYIFKATLTRKSAGGTVITVISDADIAG